jgi:hypothetical protein
MHREPRDATDPPEIRVTTLAAVFRRRHSARTCPGYSFIHTATYRFTRI